MTDNYTQQSSQSLDVDNFAQYRSLLFATHPDRPVIEHGHVTLTDAPGIGLDVTDEALRPYLLPGMTLFGETPTTDRISSPHW